jgi:hypothetical protein
MGIQRRVHRLHPREQQGGKRGHHAHHHGVVGRLEHLLVAEDKEPRHGACEGQRAKSGAEIEGFDPGEEVREAGEEGAAL